jgi:hypothetical protein
VIIDFQSDDDGNCSWNITSEGQDKLDEEDIKSLLETVLGELISKEF